MIKAPVEVTNGEVLSWAKRVEMQLAQKVCLKA